MNCKHERLTFGSGGFYVMCMECPRTWVAKKIGAASDADLGYDAGSDNLCHGSDVRSRDSVAPYAELLVGLLNGARAFVDDEAYAAKIDAALSSHYLQGASIREDEGEAHDARPSPKSGDIAGPAACREISAGLTTQPPDHFVHETGTKCPACGGSGGIGNARCGLCYDLRHQSCTQFTEASPDTIEDCKRLSLVGWLREITSGWLWTDEASSRPFVDALIERGKELEQELRRQVCNVLVEGWKLVPVEPTDAMLDELYSGGPMGSDRPAFVEAYQGMLAAAPMCEFVAGKKSC